MLQIHSLAAADAKLLFIRLHTSVHFASTHKRLQKALHVHSPAFFLLLSVNLIAN